MDVCFTSDIKNKDVQTKTLLAVNYELSQYT